jgi:prepilin-type N-terminal cleavage/methylation domain-containing protein
VPVLRGFSRSAKQNSEASTRRAEEGAKRTLSFLRPRCTETGRREAKRAGFTLVEVIVVIVIIAILAAIGVPALTGYIDKAQDKQYIAKARDFAIAARAAIDETYADGDFSNPSGITDPYTPVGPDYLESSSVSQNSKFRLWDLSNTIAWFLYGEWYTHILTNKVFAFMGEEDTAGFFEAGGQSLYIAGSLGSTVLNADGFAWLFSPEEFNTSTGSPSEIPYIIVTYKLERVENLDGAVMEPSELGIGIISAETTYNPNAGYEVYHLRYSGASW